MRVFLLGGRTSAGEEGGSRLDMKVREVEDNSVGEVVEADVVVIEFGAGIDHLDVVELLLFHCLEHGNPNLNTLKV